MDRSSFRRVETTTDLEKRQAFKANLASKLDPVQQELAINNTSSFNGVDIGGRLFHPSLGEGTLIKIDHQYNEILIDFDSKGLIPLVLTIAQSFVHAPHEVMDKIIDDPFLGSDILRKRPAVPVVHRVVDFSRIVSSDFIDPKLPVLNNTFNNVALGEKLVHPGLGEGTLIEVDHDKNAVLIDFGTLGMISLVLSQVKSILHAPIKESTKSVDDPFIGEKILRDPLDRPDVAYREVDFSPIISSDFINSKISAYENSFNGVLPGEILVHPSLGEGTLIEVDHKNNEVLIDFGSKGLIGLVLSQVKSILQAPGKEPAKEVVDAFLGEKIQRDILPVRPDVVHREVDFSRVTSVDFRSSTPSSDNIFNGVSLGGILVHPSLGEGTLVKVDYKNNEVTIDFDTNGIMNLVLSQIKNSVHAPERKSVKEVDDPFIGDKILRDPPVHHDTIQREMDFSKVISADFKDSEVSSLPVGLSVWHPDLGVCVVLSVDKKLNNLVLQTSSNAMIDMVLSQVRSKLRVIETTPEHVPMKPLVREKLAPQVSQYKSRGDVLVSLPEVFKSWQRNQQFLFLTRSQSLTTEQANDVFAVLNGDKPMFHSVKVSWQTKEETEANITPGSKALSTVIDGIKVLPNILDNKNLWHPDFGACSVHSVDEKGNLLILQTSVGHVPFVMDATLPSLAVIIASAPEHSPKRLGSITSSVPQSLGTRVLVTSDTPVTERPKVSINLPESFVTWRVLDQYQFLTVSRHLAPEQANAIIDLMTGKLHSSPTEYEIQWTDELPETNKRAEFKDQLLKRIEAASVVQELPAPPTPVDSGTKRFVTEKTVTKKESVLKVSVDLPFDFKNWTSSGQYVFLTRSRHLTFSEANDVMDTLGGKSLTSTNQYEIHWHDTEPVTYTTDSSVQRITEEVDIIEKESVLKKVMVTLPTDFKKWSNSKQYSFLTRASQLTINEANDVLNSIQNKPFNSDIDYEIIWS